ncbi:MAG: tetratricopeptide repeat protein [Planctomycetia bacterium]|nr:tetratricopeptide repeat protein [Planctomycetia bacterium]MCC7315507.1 tetratricopeptide repeat protein [Planctomycetota bacterium]
MRPGSASQDCTASHSQETPSRAWTHAAVVAAIAFGCYVPSLSSEFVRLDDYQYVIDNPLVRTPSWEGVRRFFVEVMNPSTVAGYYQPLTMLSLCGDAMLSGADADRIEPFIFHLTNVALHAVTAVLVMFLLRSVTGDLKFSMLGALLFAVHPIQVESVAWISQRKTVLATPLAIGSVIAYLQWGRTRKLGALAVSIALYVLANLAKPTVVLLPLILPFLDYWPLRRPLGKCLIEKWPFLLAMALFTWIALVSQSQSEASLRVANVFSGQVMVQWIGLLCYDVVLYLGNLVWPLYLSPVRALPDDLSLSSAPIAVSCLVVICLVGLWLWSRRRAPPLFVGLAAFAILLSPAMGPLQFAASCVSDRFLYLPSIFLLMPLVSACAQAASRYSMRKSVIQVMFGLGIVVMAALCLIQQSVWADSRSLWSRVEEMSPDDPVALSNLAIFDLEEGKLDDALRRVERAVKAAPNDARSLHTLGRVQSRRGHGAKAAALIRKALEIGLGPSQGIGHISLSQALMVTGDDNGSREAFDRGIEFGCTPAIVATDMADFALSVAHRFNQAVYYYRLALKDDPENVATRWNLGTALEATGDSNAALIEYEAVRAIYKKNGEPMPVSLTDALRKLRQKLGRP